MFPSASRISTSQKYLSSCFLFLAEGVSCPEVFGVFAPRVSAEAGVELTFLGLNANLDVLVGVFGIDSMGDFFCFFALFRAEGSSRSLSVAIY